MNNIYLKEAFCRFFKLFPVKDALFTDDDVLRTVTKNDDDGDDGDEIDVASSSWSLLSIESLNQFIYSICGNGLFFSDYLTCFPKIIS